MATVLRSDRALRTLDTDARARLAALTPHVAPGALAVERSYPVHAALEPLLPQGLMRGTTVASTGQAAASTALLLAAGASQAGSWTAVAGCPGFSPQAAVEAGVDLARVVVVRGADALDDATVGQVLGAMIDGFDVVVVGAVHRLRAGTARRLQARLQTRGAVLVVVGDPGTFAADLRVVTRCRWQGLGDGHGHLRAREVEVVVDGRRVPRPRRETLWFPDAGGRVSGRRHHVTHVDTGALGPAALERAG
jgi:hypothetical protein